MFQALLVVPLVPSPGISFWGALVPGSDCAHYYQGVCASHPKSKSLSYSFKIVPPLFLNKK